MRAESLLKNYSLLREQKVRSLAGSPGMRTSSADRAAAAGAEKRAPGVPRGAWVVLSIYSLKFQYMNFNENKNCYSSDLLTGFLGLKQ